MNNLDKYLVCNDYKKYLTYKEKGESLAINIIKNNVANLNTKNKWVDIVAISTYKKYNRFAYNYIIFEVFERKIRPNYPKKEFFTDMQYQEVVDYITWKTANDDIKSQKSNGVAGPKYIISVDIVNQKKYVYEERLWNTTFNQFVPWNWKTPSCILKKEKKCLNNYKYIVKNFKKVSDKEIRTLKKNNIHNLKYKQK
ncbi:hypothetical protein [Clostridium sp.]|uniref:hypothetical protein n=1 Tax=Clostridium sp. TaxID=1506 RepID=UPI001B73DFE7|nr:hypothetical protein [Clostridium sp.]MBP3915280.1 hypothetical protein [Clostridium sp.]